MAPMLRDEAWGLLHEVRLRGLLASIGKQPAVGAARQDEPEPA